MNKNLATALSVIFHPLLVPSYLFYIVCYQLPGVVLRPFLPDRWVVLAVVFGFTFLLPALITAGLYGLGRVDSLFLRERQQRPLPLLLAALSFGVATLVLRRPPADVLLSQMLAGMTVAVFLTFLVSLRWKISAHSVGVGGAVGFISVLQMSALAGETGVWWLVVLVVLAGAIMSARLALHAHTPAQVWAGFVLGVGIVLGFGVGLSVG